MNVLISNSVPLNGGDEALLQATVESIRARWADSNITVLCNCVRQARRRLPGLVLESDLEFVHGVDERNRVSRLYRSADIVLSAPGGFLHDFYSISDRFDGFEVALALGKPIMLFAQSVGPFWKPESLRRIPQVLNRISRICVRDSASKEHLLRCGVAEDIIRETADAAFLWRRLAPELFRAKHGQPRKIALSFRAWPLHDDLALQETICKAERLCHHLLNQCDCRLVFLSTCQGIDGYIDDSQIALDICKRLPLTLRERCAVDRTRYNPRDLIQRYSQFDAFIGMRLHGCILAMLGGTAAFGLGYEQKTAEIFKQLGLEQYQVDFDSDVETWLGCTERFLANIDDIRARLPFALNTQSDRAAVTLDNVQDVLENSRRAVNKSLAKDTNLTQLAPSTSTLQQLAALVLKLNPTQVIGLGRSSLLVSQHCPGIPFVGCDFERVDVAGQPYYQCDFNQQSLPADLKEVELIVCVGVLNRLTNLPAFLETLQFRLMPGGHLIATFNPEIPGQSDLKRILNEAGFESLEFSEFIRDFSEQPGAMVVAKARSTPYIPIDQICEIVPTGAALILVDDAQWQPLALTGRRVLPFLERNGQYWGPPENDADAVAELERMSDEGASFIIFGQPSLWWLVYYATFARFLRTQFTCLVENNRLVIFDLRDKLPRGSEHRPFCEGSQHCE